MLPKPPAPRFVSESSETTSNSILGTSLIALFFTNIPAQFLNEGIKSLVEEASPWLLLLIGGVLAGMMSADMGGPLNKTGYAIGV